MAVALRRTYWLGVVALLAAVCLAAPAWAATDYTQDPNIISWWMLDESSDGTSAVTRLDGNDRNNNDLTDTNTVASSTDKKEGNASAAFESLPTANSEKLLIADASITPTDALDPSGNFTVVFWVKPDASNASSSSVVDKLNDGNDGYRFRREGGTNAKIAFFVQKFGVGSATARSVALTDRVWSHIAGVYDGSNLIIYTNGVAGESPAYTAGAGNSTLAFQIGARANGQFFDGLVDEVAVFNRALNAREIAEIYNNGLRGAGSPIAPTQYPATY